MADQLPREVTPPPNANPCQQAVDNTPVRRKLTAHAAFAVKVPEMKEAQEKLVTETQGHYIGPMPPHLFFDEFMPWNDKTPKKFRNMQPSDERIAALQAMDGLPENKRYTKFVSCLVSKLMCISTDCLTDRCFIWLASRRLRCTQQEVYYMPSRTQGQSQLSRQVVLSRSRHNRIPSHQASRPSKHPANDGFCKCRSLERRQSI